MTKPDVKDVVPFWAHWWTTLWLQWIFFSCPGGGLQSEATPPPTFSVRRDTQAPQLLLYQPITNKAVNAKCHHLVKTTTWPYLVYHQRLDLAFEDLHASSSNNWPHIWDYALTEDLADQTVVALETSCSWVLYGKPIIIIWRHEKHPSCYDGRGNYFFIHLSKG